MATPKSKVIDKFHSKFQSPIALPSALEDEFLLTAIGDFELDLYDLNYDDVGGQFPSDLSNKEINVLGTLMYKAYLNRERDRILKLNNIIGRDIKLTAMAESKAQINKAYEQVCGEVNNLINKLKDNSFYE
jgi:hypothetical protein